ncbi:MAG: PRC-barrel domain-containing protein [Candidatus Anstonellales archaeon]
MAKVIAKSLASKKVITNDGEEIGKVVDIEINEVTGKLEYLIVDPNPENKTAMELAKEDGMLKVSYSAVLAAKDHVIIDRRFY